MKTLNDIRSEFISFFKKNDHTHIESSPLVPLNDPSLMFTNAGMVQFKDIFTGQKFTDYKRAVTSQKCVRAGGKHNDLDNVGYTGRHLTFFEMLGNFSFGDYFKTEAIKYSWDFITKNLGLNPKNLYVTVYHTDEEAFNIWKKVTGFEDNKIIKINTDDNFWSMGDTGPCGPCSEIFYDQGDKIFGGLPGSKDADGDRYVEIWNLVFMQYEQMVDRKRIELPKRSIDTGMGLERISAVIQGVYDNFKTDLFKSLINASEELTSHKAQGKYKFSHRVIADHLRSIAFLIADGVMPSNEGRGYVLRRIIRRAVRHIHLLSYHEPMLSKLLPTLINQMGETYPQLLVAESLIKDVMDQEEKNFRNTLDRGLKLLDLELENLGSKKILPGKIAFKLHDTYGFPLDLTQSILREKNLDVDTVSFNAEMQKQKDMARKAWSGSGEKAVDKIWFDIQAEAGATEFVGYNSLNAQGKVIALVQSNRKVDYIDNRQEFFIVANQTPFYGESGGQIGDIGKIELENTAIQVLDTQKPIPLLHVHRCKLEKGLVKLGDVITLKVNGEYRDNLKANHTATHLLHTALRKHLGEHVVQKGSLVSNDKLRFDFNHSTTLPKNILQKIELEINQLISQNLPVVARLKDYDQAIEEGALALFGEKYESKVRVIYVGDDSEDKYSVELCGGTHVEFLGEIGSFQIISESAVAAGIRRIEAVTKMESCKRFQEHNNIIQEVGNQLKCNYNEVVQKIDSLLKTKKSLEKELVHFKISNAKELLFAKENYHYYRDFKYLVGFIENLSAKELRELAANNINKSEKIILCLISPSKNNTVSYVVAASPKIANEIKASELIKIIADYFNSKGGGNNEFAQGGGNINKPLNKQLLTEHIANYLISK